MKMALPAKAKMTALVCSGRSRPKDSHEVWKLKIGLVSWRAITRPTSMPTSPHTSVASRPSAPANQAPLSSVLAFGALDVAVPKLLWSEREQRYLTFRETFASDAANYRFTHLYERAGLRTVENSPDEVRDLALEVLARAQGMAVYTAKDEELQRRFTGLMRPGHYSYGGITRVGRDFLRKYEHLLGDS